MHARSRRAETVPVFDSYAFDRMSKRYEMFSDSGSPQSSLLIILPSLIDNSADVLAKRLTIHTAKMVMLTQTHKHHKLLQVLYNISV